MANEEGLPLVRASGLILVMNTPKAHPGRGVFASRDIPANTTLEVSPVIVLDKKENDEHISKTVLHHYTYNWPILDLGDNDGSLSGVATARKTQAVILGLGSLFNHSTFNQNVGWIRDVENRLMTYTALRNIRRGEELCISYGDRLTFADADTMILHDGSEDEDMFAAIQVI